MNVSYSIIKWSNCSITNIFNDIGGYINGLYLQIVAVILAILQWGKFPNSPFVAIANENK